MSARSEIFADPAKDRPVPVGYLTSVVTVHREATPNDPAHLDLVALANVIVKCEGQITELALALNAEQGAVSELQTKIRRLEARDARLMELISSLVRTGDVDDVEMFDDRD